MVYVIKAKLNKQGLLHSYYTCYSTVAMLVYRYALKSIQYLKKHLCASS